VIDFLSHVRADAGRISELAEAGLDIAVPSCPGWDVAELLRHTGVIYVHKTEIVRDGWVDRQPEPVAPPGGDPRSWFREVAEEMLEVLGAADPHATAATWHPPEQNVGFWWRRMAHETVIHRLDAELAFDAVTPVDPALGADGVDEVLVLFMTDAPSWSETSLSDSRLVVTETDAGRGWGLRLGHFTGTSPAGTSYVAQPTYFLEDPAPAPTAAVGGQPGALDAWLWGRGALDELTVRGDAALVDQLRTVAADSTQ